MTQISDFYQQQKRQTKKTKVPERNRKMVIGVRRLNEVFANNRHIWFQSDWVSVWALFCVCGSSLSLFSCLFSFCFFPLFMMHVVHFVSMRLLCTLWLHGRFLFLSPFEFKCQVWRCACTMYMCIVQSNDGDNDDVDTKHRCQHKCVYFTIIKKCLAVNAPDSTIAIRSIQFNFELMKNKSCIVQQSSSALFFVAIQFGRSPEIQ